MTTTKASDLFCDTRISREECVTIVTVLIISPVSDLLFLSFPDWSASLQPEEQKVADSPVLVLTWSLSCVVFKLSFVNKTYFLYPEMTLCLRFQKDLRPGALYVKLHSKTTNQLDR